MARELNRGCDPWGQPHSRVVEISTMNLVESKQLPWQASRQRVDDLRSRGKSNRRRVASFYNGDVKKHLRETQGLRFLYTGSLKLRSDASPICESIFG
jgi:hypothetical protein